MTVPTRPVRRRDRRRRFDLRTTALFFVLLAVILCGAAFLVRAAAHMVESNPLWIGILATVGLAAAFLGRSRWRRFSAARYARRAAEALDEAAEQAAEILEPPRGTPGTLAPESIPAPESALAPESTLVLECEESTRVDYTALDADGFEQAIADLCARDACQEVAVVGGACDLGADVLAVTPDGRRIVIQCKRYGEENKVGSQDLQRFGGTCFTVHEADVAALVTTSDFTAPALEYAQQCGIVCVNGAELEAWCEGTGPSPWELVAVDA
ncbi:restriction endonuclease [Streptomyces sp. BG9H]|uniref:Restriction endonuclease n=1 Tax=Streptomyces anatolicus TaxID=2675858 RepID=A0ABS6YK72_9ACTN|nr:restriction endonuclease [Streptomyces anatolicus]MBW5421806.1 restriction endonuclease [Streptomyces anatolicus]